MQPLARLALRCGDNLMLLATAPHLVAQTARLGRCDVIQCLYPLLFDGIKVLLLLLEGALEGTQGLHRLLSRY